MIKSLRIKECRHPALLFPVVYSFSSLIVLSETSGLKYYVCFLKRAFDKEIDEARVRKAYEQYVSSTCGIRIILHTIIITPFILSQSHLL